MTTTTGIETIITVRRLPGQSLWELLVNGRKSMSSPDFDAVASSAVAAIGLPAVGGRAVVEYIDQNTMLDRARREKLGQKTADQVREGDRLRVRWSSRINAYVPCSDTAPTAEIFTVYAVQHDVERGTYTYRAADATTTRATRPFLPHEIIQLTEA